MSAPLFDYEAERRLLSAIADVSLLEGPGAARLVLERERLTAEDFHAPAHAATFAAAGKLLAQDRPIEPVALWDLLRGDVAIQRAGGGGWLAKLLVTEGFGRSAVPGYGAAIRDLSLRRRILATAKRAVEAASDVTRPPADVLGAASGELAALVRRGDEPRTLVDVLHTIHGELEAVAEGRKEPVLRTGIDVLDRVIGGLQPTLTIIGALPGVGKSALLATLSRNLISTGTKVGFFSLEDAAEWIGWRLLSDESGLNQFALRHHRLSEAQRLGVASGWGRMADYADRLLLDDRVGLTPLEVANTARDMVVNRGCRAIFVDHLGELRYSGVRKERFDLEVAEGLTELRAIAKQYGVPVVCATHLKRGAEERQNGQVYLSDFANSSAIERQARVALGLSRKPGDGRLTVWVLKQTNGKAGLKVHLDFQGAAAMVRKDGGFIEEGDAHDAG